MGVPRSPTRQAVAGVCLLAITLLGCRALKQRLGSKGAAASATASAATVASAPPPAAAPPAGPVVRNARVVDAVDAIRLYCRYSPPGVFDRCERSPIQSGARLAATDLLNDPSFVETLSVMLVEEKNPRLVLAAADLLGASGFHVYSGLDPAKNPRAQTFASAATAERLLQALRTVPEAARAVRPIVWLATSRGLADQTVAALQALPGDAAAAAETRRQGFSSLLEFGGLAAFEHVKALAASGNPQQMAAAATAVGRLRKPGQAERAAICPWLKQLLGQRDAQVFSSAGRSLLYVCHDDFPALLTELERRVAAVSLEQATLQPFLVVCRAPDPQARPRAEDEPQPLAPSAEQCAAMFTQTQKIVDDPRFDKNVRAIAFGILSERADAETLRVCSAWKVKSRSEDFRIPEAAANCVDHVKKVMSAPKAAAATPVSPAATSTATPSLLAPPPPAVAPLATLPAPPALPVLAIAAVKEPPPGAVVEITADAIALVTTSSEQPKFEAKKLFDNNPKTAWVEASPSDGEGHWVEVSLVPGTYLSHVEVSAGWGSETRFKEDLWELNSSVRIMRVSWDGGAQSVTFTRSTDRGKKRRVEIGARTTKVRFTAEAVTPGKFADLAIDDHQLFGVLGRSIDGRDSRPPD